jgi:Glycosyl transferase family 2
VEATVLIPTFNHCETLRYSLQSVQAQTLQDFEIFVVGDGAPEATRDLVADFARSEPRLRFFGFPKGERHGETHRHRVLEHAKGRCVCYLCDDDLWLPSHLEQITGMLQRSHLANTAELRIDPSGEAVLSAFDFSSPKDRVLLETNTSGFGLSNAGHTLEAYRQLPHGWRTTPEGIRTPTYMWLQFLEQPLCRAESAARPTALRFPAGFWDPIEFREHRLQTLAKWLRDATSPGGEAKIAWRIFESLWGSSTHPDGARRHARIDIHPDFPPYELGRWITVSNLESDFRHFSWGWSLREPWGVWSDGEEARLTFSLGQVPATKLAVDLRFIAPLSPQRPTNFVEVIANGDSVARWMVDQAGEQERCVEIPAQPRLDLRFLTPHAPPLSQVADTTDHRRVGIGLLALKIRPAS